MFVERAPVLVLGDSKHPAHASREDEVEILAERLDRRLHVWTEAEHDGFVTLVVGCGSKLRLGMREPSAGLAFLRQHQRRQPIEQAAQARGRQAGWRHQRSESTRLNSSHSQISYAVFCLKKKKTNK